MGVRIADGVPAQRELAWRCLDHGLGLDEAFFERQAHHQRFDRRARLKGVGQRSVAQLRAGEVGATVRHIAGVVGQGQHFTGLDIQHHHTARSGAVVQHGFAQFLVGKELHLAVDGELNVTPIHRRHHLANVLDHMAQTVFDDATRA